ncbi:MAG: 5-formyltetrahydrofolate cyclo-ligase [Victivallales bacterium]
MTVSKQSDKKSLRREKLLLRKSMVPDAVERIADAATPKNLESLPEFAEASVIAAYASDGTEPDLMPLLRRAAGTGKTIGLPRWCNDSNYEMAVLDGDFKTVSGKWNMPEPPPYAPPAETQLLERALWLVPGVAFDENCAQTRTRQRHL